MRRGLMLIALAALGGAILLASVGWFTLSRHERAADRVRWVSHTLEVMRALDTALLSVLDAESNQRGYMLTGDPQYLAPYHAAEERLRSELDALDRLVADRAIQAGRASNLRVLVAQRMERLRAGLAAHDQNVPFTFGPGQQVMERIRAQVTTMENEESALLRSRSEEAEVALAATVVSFGYGLALSLGCIVTALVLTARQFARRHHAEEKLRQANQRLEREVAARTAELEQRTVELARSNRELEQFASVASHDLQEPLRMVTSYLGLLERRVKDALDDKSRQYIATAVSGAMRMSAMIRALLDYSRINAQAARLEEVPADDALTDALANLGPRIEEARATITREELPAVKADRALLSQLFQNLVGNALKFVRGREPAVSISAARDGRCWRITVADNGIGIAAEHQQRLFRMFERLNTQDEFAGTGIGLAACQRIVERLGGRIWVESELGTGSRFHFTVPMIDVDRREDEPALSGAAVAGP